MCETFSKSHHYVQLQLYFDKGALNGPRGGYGVNLVLEIPNKLSHHYIVLMANPVWEVKF